jgi:hypothetical protein
MKTIKLFSAIALVIAFTFNSFAQSKTESFQVSGNCGMCKTRIEKAAKDAGAASASWDKDTKQLTVTYESSLTNTAKIQQKLADVGHDNPGFKTTDDVYNKLPGCCKYDRTKEVKEEKHVCTDKCEKKDGKCAKMEGDHTKMSCGSHGENHKSENQKGKSCCEKDGDNAKCEKEGKDAKECCKKGAEEGKDCCKNKLADKKECKEEGHDGKACCKKEAASCEKH